MPLPFLPYTEHAYTVRYLLWSNQINIPLEQALTRYIAFANGPIDQY